MPWYIYSLARGSVLFWGAGATLVALLMRTARRSIRKKLFAIIAVVAILLIVISAAALPIWLYAIWLIATAEWLIRPSWNKPRVAVAMRSAAVVLTAIAVIVELSHAIRPSPPAGRFARLYVIGDSISAGLGAEHGRTWPVLIRTTHRVDVVDFSQPGATVATAHDRLNRA